MPYTEARFPVGVLYIIMQFYICPGIMSYQKYTPNLQGFNLKKGFAAIILSLIIIFIYTTTYFLEQIVTDDKKLHHHAWLVLENEEHAIYVKNLQKCLHAINLTDYFYQKQRLTKAIANMKHYLDVIHKFIPYQFIGTLPNHCWDGDVKLDFESSLVSGHINGTNFRVNRTDIEHFQHAPLNTLPFYGGTDYPKHHYLPFSCIPEIFLAGFHKCGSSSVYSLITSHPAVSKSFRKEANWFIESYHFSNEIVNDALYFADYLINFESLVQKLSLQNSNPKATLMPSLGVDGTVGLMKLWPTFSDTEENIINSCLTPSVFLEVLPKAKFIVVMREPLSMVYSLFWYSCTRFHQPMPSLMIQQKGPDIFHDRVVKIIHGLNSCIAEFPLAKCITIDYTHELFNPLMPKCGQVEISMALYYIHVKKWISIVPCERFLFLKLEELSTNINQNAKQIWKFLGVDPLFDIKSLAKAEEQTKVDYKNNPHLAMRNDTRDLLQRFFHPYNRMLAELLGDRKFLWETERYV